VSVWGRGGVSGGGKGEGRETYGFGGVEFAAHYRDLYP